MREFARGVMVKYTHNERRTGTDGSVLSVKYFTKIAIKSGANTNGSKTMTIEIPVWFLWGAGILLGTVGFIILLLFAYIGWMFVKSYRER